MMIRITFGISSIPHWDISLRFSDFLVTFTMLVFDWRFCLGILFVYIHGEIFWIKNFQKFCKNIKIESRKDFSLSRSLIKWVFCWISKKDSITSAWVRVHSCVPYLYGFCVAGLCSSSIETGFVWIPVCFERSQMTCGRIQTFLSLPVKLQTIDAKGSNRLVFCLRCPWQILKGWVINILIEAIAIE